ncbi:TonB-dependent receptor [Idiomarina sp.]|uniref:TonB-dependent receptor n=1 Tax=Idiomarina sp. TaxID=1874361 RepID=UPI0025C103CB|nr:TonB-dependent receptor [Idiomarina sp.]
MKSQFFKRTLTAAAVAAAMGMSASAVAQNTTGSVTGSVINNQQEVVTGASVTIRNVETGYTRTIQVGEDGQYRFPSLPTGRYTLTANASGFEPNQTQEFVINAGSSRDVTVPLYTDIETIDVSGTAISMVDTRSSSTSLNIGEAEIDRIPVPRNATSVALLAPSTTAGDNRFGNLASFGGASVAENAVYINGLNVTNFRNGLGFSDVPFEFYKEFEVLTGGYSAEFGRSTGGVINAVTKSGTNEFEVNANVYYSPDSFREQSPDVRRRNGEMYIYNAADERDELEANISVSGAIIEDTLFYYAIYNPRDLETNSVGSEGTSYFNDQSDDAFWGAKVDWQINSNHLMEFLAFSDSSTTDTQSFGYDLDSNSTVGNPQTSYSEAGGDNWSVKYTGYLTDDLSVTAMYGENEYSLTEGSDPEVYANCTLIQDTRDTKPYGLNLGCADASNYSGQVGVDTREAMRIDFEWYLGDHLLRFGYDSETNTSFSQQSYSGPEGAYYLISNAVNDEGNQVQLPNGTFAPEGYDAYASQRIRTVGGEFETEATAFYVEDVWSITDNVTATLGVRWETFDNKNAGGETFVKIDDMVAPRLGISWDPNGDGQSKVFANVGRYFLPVANNTNVRLSGNEFDQTSYYALEGVEQTTIAGFDAYDLILGPQIGNTVTNADGTVPDTRSIVDADIDPMYQDEFILGYQTAFAENWSWGIRGIRRELSGAIDDMSIEDGIMNKFGCENYFQRAWYGDGSPSYVLGNPGEEMTVYADTNCDFTADSWVTFSPEELGYPSAERNYSAVELTLNKAWDQVWSMSASYTWSKSYGNTEGLVKSDIAQTDAGITQDFDFPSLMDGAYGDLPNDRRHTFKVYGSYALMEDFTVGANVNISSGRPLNAFGIGHPDGVPVYGDTFYVCSSNCGADAEGEANYTQMPRGTYGETEWSTRIDLNAQYTTMLGEFETNFRVDVFNVLNSAAVTRRYEFAESGGPGDANPLFMTPTSFQSPRYVQFSASVKF